MKNHIKSWLREIVDDAESISKHHYDEHMEFFKKEEIFIDKIREKIFQQNPKSKAIKEDKAINEAFKQYYESIEKFLESQYEIWRGHEEEKKKVKKMQYMGDSVPREPGGASLTKQLSLVLYELKDKDPAQFNLFCETFL